MPAETQLSQTKSGMRPSVMPGQRMHRIVATKLSGRADAADAATSSPIVQ